MTERDARLIIVGSGPAGYTAAIYAARAMLKPVLIEGIQPGGQLTITTDVENYPGFAEAIQGPWLMEQMRAQALHVGAEIVQDHIMSVDFAHRPFVLRGDSGTVYSAESRHHLHGRPGPVARAAERAEIPGLRCVGLRDLRWLLL